MNYGQKYTEVTKSISILETYFIRKRVVVVLVSQLAI